MTPASSSAHNPNNVARPHPPLDYAQEIESLVASQLARLAEVHGQNLLDLKTHPERRGLREALAGSDFIARSLIQDAALLGHLSTLETPRATGEIAQKLATLSGDREHIARALREIRRRELTRLAWRDLAGYAPLQEVLLTLSELADAAIEAALRCAHQEIRSQFGEPIGESSGQPVALSVLGLGKLGGRELNMSSDIDLIFSYREAGQTNGAKSISNHEFFIKVGQLLIDLLQRPTEEGFVFRVDMRLRPNGDSGPLVLSFDAIDHYYLTHGRDWERYALIKARPVAGDRKAGFDLIQSIRPFVYRKYLDFGAIEAIRNMKSLIERELTKKSLENDIKLGRGGIREIEFIVQSHQLIFGGRNADLQTPSIYAALRVLAAADILPTAECATLESHYESLRTIEHRLQLLEDQQTHSLPKDAFKQSRIAHAAGFRDPEELAVHINTINDEVHRLFQTVFRQEPRFNANSPAEQFEEFWRGAVAGQIDLALLRAAGFQEPEAASELLVGIPRSRFYQAFSREGRERLDLLMPAVIQNCLGSDAPNTAIARMVFVIQSIGRRSAYLAMLAENPLALSQLTKLVCASNEVSQWIAQHPVILDELLDPIANFHPQDSDAILLELRRRMERIGDDLEAAMEALREFRQAFTLRVAAADIAGLIDTRTVASALCGLAQAVLTESLGLAERTLKTVDRPPNGDLGIVAYGKLGSEELGYHSDLDIVFIFDEPDSEASENGLARRYYFGRLVQRLIHILTTRTPAGDAYAIDTRLRPSGNSGTAVTPLRAYEDYLKNSAWTWEHQALVRARLVVGSQQLEERFGRIRESVLCQPRDLETLKDSIRGMRERMRKHRDSEKSPSVDFDLKHDLGGLIDIEFLCQYWVLANAADHPALIEARSSRRIIAELKARGLISESVAICLSEALEIYLSAENAMKLSHSKSHASRVGFDDHRKGIQQIWAQTLGDPTRPS